MPDLLILLSTFGGLSMFGAVGLVLGPIIASLFIAVWQIYGEAFGELLGTDAPAAEGPSREIPGPPDPPPPPCLEGVARVWELW